MIDLSQGARHYSSNLYYMPYFVKATQNRSIVRISKPHVHSIAHRDSILEWMRPDRNDLSYKALHEVGNVNWGLRPHIERGF
jgi:hypothetical protein